MSDKASKPSCVQHSRTICLFILVYSIHLNSFHVDSLMAQEKKDFPPNFYIFLINAYCPISVNSLIAEIFTKLEMIFTKNQSTNQTQNQK